MIPFAILGAFLLGGAGGPPAAPAKQKCVSDGRYWIHQDKGQKVYCFDGEGYNEAEAPPGIKSYFQPVASVDPGAVPASAPTLKTVPTTGAKSSAFTGTPSLPSGGSGGGGGSGSFSISGAGGGGGGGGGGKSAIRDLENMIAGQSAQDRGGVGGGGRIVPPKERGGPVGPESVSLVGVGMGRSDVTDRLGSPHGRIMNSGDDGVYEIWTYLTRGGGSASIRLREGKVVSIRKPE